MHGRVVLPGLDHIAASDAQAVAASRGAVVVDLAGAYPFVADARVQLARFVVRRDGDRISVTPLTCERVLEGIRAFMHHDEAERMKAVEQRFRMLPASHLHGERGVRGVGETVHGRHAVHAGEELRGHVEHAAAADRGELCAVADQSEGGAVLVGDGQERERRVLVEHARFIDHDPLAADETSGCRGAGVRGIRIGVDVANGEPGPYAVAIPSPPVLMDQLRDTVCCNAEFLMRNIGRLLRRRDHPGCAAVRGGGFNCGGEHRGLARAGCALHDDERIDGCHGRGRSRLRRVEPVPVRDVRQVWCTATRDARRVL